MPKVLSDNKVATENTNVQTTTVQTEQTSAEGKQEQTQGQTQETTQEKTIEQLQKEFEARLQSETDRRVTEALKKAREKWEKELEERERLAKLSEEERAKELERKRLEEIAKRERAIEEKELQIALRDFLVEEGLDVAFKDIFVVSKYVGQENKEEALKQDILKVKEIFNALVDKKVEEFKQEYLRGETPAGVQAEKKELSAFEKAKQSGNALNMILSKL